MRPRIWLIAGPTASGKSALALRLARQTGARIVNADSMQLYRDLRVLTARPSPEEEAAAPHHLFGTADAADGWSTGRWLRAVHQVLEEFPGTVVVVGGTGLYFNALTNGLATVPAASNDKRLVATEDYERLGEAAFRERLAGPDPAAEARISPGDRQRLVRAWEVYLATGRSLTELQTRGEGALPAGSWRAVALEPPREALYARCDARLEAMLEQGALDEVRDLAARGLDPNLPAMKALGVREFSAHLRGETGLAQALEAAQRETRRYAKRQATWMRGRMADWPRLTEIDHEAQWGQFLALNPVLTGAP